MEKLQVITNEDTGDTQEGCSEVNIGQLDDSDNLGLFGSEEDHANSSKDTDLHMPSSLQIPRVSTQTTSNSEDCNSHSQSPLLTM